VKTGQKFVVALALLVASCLLLAVDGWFGLGIVVGLPLTILLWIDLGRELRTAPGQNRGSRAAGLLMGIPQALFGVLCLGVGVAIICWVLYNSLWRRDPNYTGGWLSFGIAPLLSLFGVGLTVDAFKRAPGGTGIDHSGGSSDAR
jgi:uncharacterized membrane protein